MLGLQPCYAMQHCMAVAMLAGCGGSQGTVGTLGVAAGAGACAAGVQLLSQRFATVLHGFQDMVVVCLYQMESGHRDFPGIF